MHAIGNHCSTLQVHKQSSIAIRKDILTHVGANDNVQGKVAKKSTASNTFFLTKDKICMHRESPNLGHSPHAATTYRHGIMQSTDNHLHL